MSEHETDAAGPSGAGGTAPNAEAFASRFEQPKPKPKPSADEPEKKKRGRPKGSKNKPKGLYPQRSQSTSAEAPSTSRPVSAPKHATTQSEAEQLVVADESGVAEAELGTLRQAAAALPEQESRQQNRARIERKKRKDEKERALVERRLALEEKRARVLPQYERLGQGVQCVAGSYVEKKLHPITNKLNNLAKHVEGDEHKANTTIYDRFLMGAPGVRAPAPTRRPHFAHTHLRNAHRQHHCAAGQHVLHRAGSSTGGLIGHFLKLGSNLAAQKDMINLACVLVVLLYGRHGPDGYG